MIPSAAGSGQTVPEASGQYPALYRNRTFLLLFSASTLSVLGNAFHALALSLWVLQETGSARMMSILTISNLLLCSLLGSVTGTLADRMNRRTLIMCSYLVQSIAVLAIAFTLTLISPSYILIICLTGIVTAAGQFQAPAFQASLLPVVGKDYIQQAAGWMTLSENISRTLGYALGGIFVAAVGGAWAVFVDGMTFMLACLLVAAAGSFAGNFPAADHSARSFKQDVAGGFRYIWGHAFARSITILLPVLTMFFLSCLMLTQVMAVQIWKATPFQFGLLESSIPLGYMLGSGMIILAGKRLKHRGIIVSASLMLLGPLYILLSVTSAMNTALPVILLIGFTFSFSTLLINIILRLEVPGELQGRMFGVLGSLMSVAPPLGLAVFSAGADVFGVSIVMGAAGVLLSLFGTSAVLMLKQIRRYK
ncbi:MFS transporter [Paenibacillus typhae]|uniref:Transmembrane secretion effector n=1 Tax=Paenibacillus typhae TaxID=1174501 RepID=A0A1G8GR89_9BACL|nr:MFS transporter [Paenibacillus typhae]SDH96869.1 Transmembrane secretion effector [Paenibacillus typhae]